MSASAPMRLGIVGVGLIGGSIALAARRAWPDAVRVGVDDGRVLDAASARGCIDVLARSIDDLADCDIVILATPVPAILTWLERWPADHPAVLTDTGSTKREIAAAGRRLPRFLGGHPLAGSARGGVEAATPDLFDARDWFLTPGGNVDPAVLTRVSSFVAGLGARPVEIEADAHDRAMAYLSHVPQLVSVALMNAAVRGGATRAGVTGGGFRDMTRLASSPGELWRGILATNADYVAEALDALRAALPVTGSGIDLSRVGPEFAAAGRARDELFGEGD